MSLELTAELRHYSANLFISRDAEHIAFRVCRMLRVEICQSHCGPS